MNNHQQWISCLALPLALFTQVGLADNRHEGVASCASSICHGSVSAFSGNSHILHNEYVTWSRQDKHSQAYQTLLTPQAQSIVGKLGLGAAHTLPLCLDCHTSHVPASNQGARFQVTDGIGCESCHGGAEHWLSSHTDRKTTHSDNVQAGLTPLDDVVVRAKLCLSCHIGNRDQFVTHRIMGAGHPRISFELDTFSELQPPHYQLDQDYTARKQSATHVQSWAVGQAVAAQLWLDVVLSKQFRSAGIFPELSLFDCHACHHPMSHVRWQQRQGTGLGPGVVHFNDASLVMLRNIIKPIKPALGRQLLRLTQDLHSASETSYANVTQVATQLTQLLHTLIPLVQHHPYSERELNHILDGLVTEGLQQEYQDYAAAEQVGMGVVVLLSALGNTAEFSNVMQARIDHEVDALYRILQKDEQYNRQQFPRRLKRIQRLLAQMKR